MNTILLAVGLVAGIGLLIGLILSIASIITSPPERVVTGWPSFTYGRPTSRRLSSFGRIFG